MSSSYIIELFFLLDPTTSLVKPANIPAHSSTNIEILQLYEARLGKIYRTLGILWPKFIIVHGFIIHIYYYGTYIRCRDPDTT